MPVDASQALLCWYAVDKRSLPWRAEAGARPDPYRVWLSEIMLQQTTVKAVESYYVRFLERWPSVRDLAAAPLEDVLRLWAGLGYYARARNLHACARAVTECHGGVFPADEAALRPVREYHELETGQQGQALGDALPVGLRLVTEPAAG